MNQKIEFSQFINNQKQLREQTGKLTADTVERVWGDMEEFPRLLDVAERFNLASGTLGGGQRQRSADLRPVPSCHPARFL